MTKTFDASLQVSWKTGVLCNNGDPEEMQINYRNIKGEIFKNQFFKIHSSKYVCKSFSYDKDFIFYTAPLVSCNYNCLSCTSINCGFCLTLKDWYNLHQHTSIVIKMRINHHFISLETCTIYFLIKKPRIFIIVNGEKLPNIRLVNEFYSSLKRTKTLQYIFLKTLRKSKMTQ